MQFLNFYSFWQPNYGREPESEETELRPSVSLASNGANEEVQESPAALSVSRDTKGIGGLPPDYGRGQSDAPKA